MKQIVCITMTWVVLAPSLVRSAELPTNNDPDRQIRFANAGEATARRNEVIRFIWHDGIPLNLQPKVTEDVGNESFKEHLKGVDRSLVKRVDRLDVHVLGLNLFAYLIHPVRSSDSPGLGIVHAGHSKLGDYMKRDYYDSIHLFLEKGDRAIMMHMPQKGWNDVTSAVLPGGKVVTVTDHASLVELPQHDPSLSAGSGFRPFLEPVIVCINHAVQLAGDNPDVTMIGLSGGGWTTHMAAALDTRIRLSFPVAGSYPLYLRNRAPDRGSVGDLEQYFTPLYDENIAVNGSGGGVATWLEIYALGGYGKRRRQVMVTAQFDSCCFNGAPEETVDTFKDVVARTVQSLGHGKWEHRLDTTHRSHQISPWVVDEVIEPNLLP